MIFTLAIRNLLVRRTRTLLTAAAVALSVSLVVSVTSGYASIESAANRLLSMFLANTDARVVRQNESYGGVPESVLEAIRADEAVVSAVGRIEIYSSLLDQQGQPISGRNAMLIGLTRPEDQRVQNMEMIAGDWFESSDQPVCVLDQATALTLKNPANIVGDEAKGMVAVGDTITLPGPVDNLRLRVVGIVHKPKILAMLQPSIYVPIETLQRWSGSGSGERLSSILIDLKPEADAGEFGNRWRPKLEALDPNLKLKLTSEQRSEIDKNLQGLRIGSYAAGAVSMLAAAFIVFSALSMGVKERQRTLGMMRAVGATRWQLGRLVVVESVLLSTLGAAIGIGLGFLWLAVLWQWFSDVMVPTVSAGGILFASGGSVAAATIASILPAWGATRTHPLEAMSPLAAPQPLGRALLWAIPGVLLLSVDSMLVFGPWRALFTTMGIDQPDMLAREVTLYGHFAVGLLSMMLGFFLVSPLFVVVVERLLGPMISRGMGVKYPLLRQQLSGGVWRSAGTAAALMIGLAILIVLQVQGNTVVGGWRIPDRFPDLFITSYKFGGLSPEEIENVRNVDGIVNKEVLPIAIASPEFGSTIFSIRGMATMPEATMFFGIDPKLGIDMMQLDFRDGSPEQAVKLMTENRRHIIVTEEFRQLKGLKTGDKMSLKTPKHGVVEYTIAGVVWSPGIDVIVSVFDLGKQFEQRTAASLFGTLEDARDDFGVTGVYLFAVNISPGLEKEVVTERIRKEVGMWGLQAGDVRVIKGQIQHHFRKILLMVSTVAFAAMAVASLGVTNTIMASVRVRRWQFGILRSIGLTRGQLLRLVLAEALLLGAAGCVLGVACGTVLAINAKQMLLVLVGYDPAFTIPWGIIGVGATIVIAIALLAGLWPALSTARTSPLTLLQSGRAAA